MNKRKLFEKIYNNHRNVKFSELVTLVEAFGFTLIRVKGSHHIFARDDIPAIVNLQNDQGEAKPYQVKQFLSIVEKYHCKLED